jgi:hypothetical protein
MYRYALIALTTALTPVVASAQTAPAPAPAAGATATASAAVGATVYDAQGGVVGTIASTDGANAVIDTGTVKAVVPVASLGTGAKGPTLGMTKAQLDAAAGQQTAQATQQFQSQLVAGATVYGTGGATLGTIKATDAQYVTLKTPKGEAKLPIAGFGPGEKGVTLGMSAAQLDAAMSGAATPAPAAAATPPAK